MIKKLNESKQIKEGKWGNNYNFSFFAEDSGDRSVGDPGTSMTININVETNTDWDEEQKDFFEKIFMDFIMENKDVFSEYRDFHIEKS